jgi:hypothetical protein
MGALAGGGMQSAVRAEGWQISADFAGEVRLVAPMPEIPWRLTFETEVGGAAQTQATLVATLPGGELTLIAHGGKTAQRYDWILAEQSLPMAELQPMLGEWVTELAEVDWDGDVVVSGAGHWIEGKADGEIRFGWAPRRVAWSRKNAVMKDAASTDRFGWLIRPWRTSPCKCAGRRRRWAIYNLGRVKWGCGEEKAKRGSSRARRLSCGADGWR